MCSPGGWLFLVLIFPRTVYGGLLKGLFDKLKRESNLKSSKNVTYSPNRCNGQVWKKDYI